MCDFDIASFREKAANTTKKSDSGKEESSFSLYLKKRKMLGLDDDSDSDSDTDNKIDPLNKRKTKQDVPTTSPPSSESSFKPDPSPLDFGLEALGREKVSLNQDLDKKVLLKHGLDTQDAAKETTDKRQQPYVQNAIPTPILLDEDDLPVKKSDTTCIIDDGTTNSSQRPKKTRLPRTVSLDIEDLDPELASIFSQDTEGSSTADSRKAEIVPEKVQIKVSYVPMIETIDVKVRNFIDTLSKPVKIIMLNNSPFDILMEQFCKKKVLSMKDMVLVYENIPVVLRATPASLLMSTTSTNKMEVYKRTDFNKKMEIEREIKAARLSQRNYSDDEDGQDYDGDGYKSPEEEPEDEFLHVKLRGKDNKDIGLRVKQTTRIDAMIKQYIRLMELDLSPDKIQLSFEGETLAPSITIADTDLEDEDMLSVVIHS